MKSRFNPIDIFFLPRPFLLIPVWGFCIFGYYHGFSFNKRLPFSPFVSLRSLEAFTWMVIFSFSVASVYILNQIVDVDVDKANGGLPLIAKGRVTPKSARIFAFILAVIGVGLPLLRHPTISIMAIAALITGIIYCVPPFRLSGRPGFDFLANATGFAVIAFGAGWFLSGASFAVVPFLSCSLPYFLLMCAGSISSTIPDYNGDKKYGKNTTAVVFGILNAHSLATFFLCLAMGASLITRHYIPLACALCAFPVYVFYFFKRDDRIMEATYKVGGGLCMAFASYLMPVFGAALIAVTLGTYFYFKKRHGVNYPTLVVTHEE